MILSDAATAIRSSVASVESQDCRNAPDNWPVSCYGVTRAPMPQGNVLVVEDDDTVRRLVIQILRARSLAVDGARDGAEALHQIATKQYALVILDLMMPHMSGVDFLDSLKVLAFDPTLRTIQQPPAVLVITSAPEETVPSCELQRRFPMVRGVLRKPLDSADLSRRVDALLQ